MTAHREKSRQERLYAGTIAMDKDFYAEVAKGNVLNHSLVHKFGRNDNVAISTWEPVTQLGTINWRTSAATMRVKVGGNAADTAAGDNAREVVIQGIVVDSNGNLTEGSEAVATAGASASAATTLTFWRVHRAWVSATGTYGAANLGAITIEDSAGAADQIIIAAAEGQSQFAAYTIPEGYTGYMISVSVTVDSNKVANIRCFAREAFDTVAAPMQAPRIKFHWDGVVGAFNFQPVGPTSFLPEKTDVWFEAYGDGGAIEASVDFEILLVKDGI